jgi:hypothetical protein
VELEIDEEEDPIDRKPVNHMSMNSQTLQRLNPILAPQWRGSLLRLVRTASILSLAGATSIASAMPRTNVRHHGAAGNGVIDDAAAIQSAIDTSPLGAVIDFGSGFTYRITNPLTLRPARSYIGSSKIKMDNGTAHGTPIAILPYGQAVHIRIEGLTFDASGVGGILLISVGGSNLEPATDLIVRNNLFENSNPDAASDAQSALYEPVGMRNSEITGNRFVNVGKAIVVTNPANTLIARNQFDRVLEGNAVSIHYGEGSATRAPVTISHNTGRNLSRMAIEVFHTAGSPPQAVTVASNRFSDWAPAALRKNEAYGISMAGGSGHRVVDNELNGAGPYGIEVGSPDTLVDGNTIDGFEVGIVLQQASGSVISNNRLLHAQLDGITLSNAGAHKNIKVVGNYIENAKRAGIGGFPAVYDGIEFSNNKIVRVGGYYPDDNSVAFYGFQVQPRCVAPSVWKNNTIIQMGPAPPPGFRFFGFGVFGKCAGNHYASNFIESRSITPLGCAFLVYDAGVLDGDTIEDNHFGSLAQVLDGHPATRVSASDNVSCNTRNVNLESTSPSPVGCKPKPASFR